MLQSARSPVSEPAVHKKLSSKPQDTPVSPGGPSDQRTHHAQCAHDEVSIPDKHSRTGGLPAPAVSRASCGRDEHQCGSSSVRPDELTEAAEKTVSSLKSQLGLPADENWNLAQQPVAVSVPTYSSSSSSSSSSFSASSAASLVLQNQNQLQGQMKEKDCPATSFKPPRQSTPTKRSTSSAQKPAQPMQSELYTDTTDSMFDMEAFNEYCSMCDRQIPATAKPLRLGIRRESASSASSASTTTSLLYCSPACRAKDGLYTPPASLVHASSTTPDNPAADDHRRSLVSTASSSSLFSAAAATGSVPGPWVSTSPATPWSISSRRSSTYDPAPQFWETPGADAAAAAAKPRPHSVYVRSGASLYNCSAEAVAATAAAGTESWPRSISLVMPTTPPSSSLSASRTSAAGPAPWRASPRRSSVGRFQFPWSSPVPGATTGNGTSTGLSSGSAASGPCETEGVLAQTYQSQMKFSATEYLEAASQGQRHRRKSKSGKGFALVGS